MNKHIHVDIIVAWANGEEIQEKLNNGQWRSMKYDYAPNWNPMKKYRIKPSAPVEPDYGKIAHDGFYKALDARPLGMPWAGAAKAVLEAQKVYQQELAAFEANK